MATNAIEEAVIVKLRQLPMDKQQAVLDFVAGLTPSPKRPRKSLYGLWAGRGVSISEDDIAEARNLCADPRLSTAVDVAR